MISWCIIVLVLALLSFSSSYSLRIYRLYSPSSCKSRLRWWFSVWSFGPPKVRDKGFAIRVLGYTAEFTYKEW